MPELTELLNYVVFTYGDQPISLGRLLLAPCILVLLYWFVRWAVNAFAQRLERNNVAPDLVLLTRRLTFTLSLVILLITGLELLNVPLTAFAFVSGAVAIGVGFGAQNIINNFISGWILMWERPIRIGDFLEVENSKGVVETINTRSTRVRRTDGVHMLIPNSKLLENTVVNWTLIDRLARSSVRVGVAYGSPARRVGELLQQAVDAMDSILQEPPPAVIFDDFGDNALMFEVFFWVNATVDRDLRRIRSELRFSIDQLFADNGIVIAFPQRDVHIDGAITVVHPTGQSNV